MNLSKHLIRFLILTAMDTFQLVPKKALRFDSQPHIGLSMSHMSRLLTLLYYELLLEQTPRIDISRRVL